MIKDQTNMIPTMKYNKKKTAIWLLSSLVMLNGCQMSDANLTRLQTTMTGCGIGGAAGALVSNDRLKGGLVGCGGGAIAGAIFGEHVVERKKEFASEEDYLAGVLAQAKAVNEDAKTMNKALQTEISGLEKQKKVLANQKMDAERKNQETLALQENASALADQTRTAIAKLDEEIKMQNKVLSEKDVSADDKLVYASYTPQISKQVSNLKMQQSSLQKKLKRLEMIDLRKAY